jgi:hypothetical protein
MGVGRYLPSEIFPALKAASPVAFFWRAVSKFFSIVSGSEEEDIVVEKERDGDERRVDSYIYDYSTDVLLSYTKAAAPFPIQLSLRERP